jgi:hypothetical protein
MGKMSNCYNILVPKPVNKRPCGRTTVVVGGVMVFEDGDRVHVAQDKIQ